MKPNLKIDTRWGHLQEGDRTASGPGGGTNGTRVIGYLDVHLNAINGRKNKPEADRKYILGGHQIFKKRLSHREHVLIGRSLTSDKAHTFTHKVPPIAAIIAPHWQLDC